VTWQQNAYQCLGDWMAINDSVNWIMCGEFLKDSYPWWLMGSLSAA
jgi:hypothetical protein